MIPWIYEAVSRAATIARKDGMIAEGQEHNPFLAGRGAVGRWY